jgi:CDP-diacylglycerol---serine O-phosphatidyltransferase
LAGGCVKVFLKFKTFAEICRGEKDYAANCTQKGNFTLSKRIFTQDIESVFARIAIRLHLCANIGNSCGIPAAYPLFFTCFMRHLPNFITLCNLFFGCCALLFTLNGAHAEAAWCTAASFLCDYADGMIARALRVSSPLGKELDSLADVVSFGVVPGAMLYMLLKNSVYTDAAALSTGICLPALPAFVLSMFSALRLGKFNLDTRQTTYFLGLSTPACTVLVLGLTLAVATDRFEIRTFALNPVLLYALIGVLSALLVSEIPMFGMKIKKFDLRSNIFNLTFLALFVIALFFLKELALVFIVLLYIALSVLFRKNVLV